MSPEMEIPGRLLFSVAAAEAVPVLELAGGATPEEDSLLATTECRSLASALVPVPFSMLTCGKFCRAFEELALAGFSLVISGVRSEEHTSELQSHSDLVCRLLLEKKKI